MDLFKKAGVLPGVNVKGRVAELNDQHNAQSLGKQSNNISRYAEFKSKVDKLSNELSLILHDKPLTSEDTLVITGSVCEKDNKISIIPSIHIINEGNRRLEIKDCDGNVSKHYTLISDFKHASPISNSRIEVITPTKSLPPVKVPNFRPRLLNGGKKSCSKQPKNVALKRRKTRKLSKE
jgi:hypothetical protein